MGVTEHQRRYAAFISYAHADEVMAARLHKALETYPVPRNLRAQGKTTKPVFRDVAELTAAHSLSEKIQEAVKGSRVLIVLCSPAAKASHWVNEEIRLFRKLNGDAAILSAIIDGTPDTSFPEALIEGGREPLAAALGTDKAGFKLGVTQLAAGILGTGLDDLVQRGAKRRNRLMGAGLAASLALSGVMGFATLQAVEGRKEAILERTESEALLEYMIKDLKVKLEPVGRLELLEGVGRRAIDYYDKKEFGDLSDDNLRLLAAARQVLAQVHLDAGRMEEAQREIEASAALTREVLVRNPDDTDAIFAHAQSEYWVGAYYREQGKLAEMEEPWREYDRLAQVLYQKNPTNFDWVMEAGWGKNNLGIWAREQNSSAFSERALGYYSSSINYFESAVKLNANSKLAKVELSNAMSGKGQILLSVESKDVAKNFQLIHLKILENLVSSYPEDVSLKLYLIVSKLDFYIHYYVGPESRKVGLEINSTFDELFELIEHDSQNLKYKSTFLDYIFESLNIFSLENLVKRREQAETIMSETEGFNSRKISYYNNMLQIMSIKIDHLNSQVEPAETRLLNSNEDFKKLEGTGPDDWRVFHSAYIENMALKRLEDGEYFAHRFLTAINSETDLNIPRISFFKVRVFNTIRKCKKANALAQNLQARDYISKEQLQKLYC